ncbi:uncharacterized protein Bfra_005555ib [Botrytis fragariae]|uniref:DUF6604 domain-containing protein n=1 Tax=Botrytis fragariae TaxID=1964551 RepID=A0A8H6ARC7_9HELO|nr:uncharacterized protein Bfra_005555ib [Botrytis fragariae]KAF5872202.1 hypothetical protein Bfra_005555ib [Botrytis fragariae]
MPPQFPIVDTWKSYKELEKRFLGWLVKTASATGQDLESPDSTPRLKYIMSITEVVISEKHELPSNVRDDLAQVISKRKEAAEWYGRYNQDDSGHMYYLETLQTILQLFEDLYSKDPDVVLDDETNRKPRIDSETTNDEGVTNNQFGSLEIESTHLSSSDSDSDGERNSTGGSAKNHRKPKAKKKGKNGKNQKSGKIRKNKIEIPTEEQITPLEVDASDPFDEYLRVYFFLKDMNVMRNYILDQWNDYSIELLSLANVSLVTNQAMAIFQWAENGLLSHLPSDKQSYENIANIMCPDVNKLMEKIKNAGATDFNELMYLEDKSDESQEHNAVVKTEDYLCYTTWSVLSEWHKESSVDQHQRSSNHRVVTPEDTKKFTLEDKIDLNRTILHELLYEVWHLKKEMISDDYRNYFEDAFTKGIRDFLTTKEIPIWLVFAAQIMCDIRFILGKEVVRCHDEVVLFSSHMLQHLKNCFKTASIHHLHDFHFVTYQLYNDLWAYNLKDWMSPNFDPPPADWEHEGMHPTPISKNNHEKFSYLRLNPVMCGTWILGRTIRYHEAGNCNTAFEPSTISCIHLYNALRQESLKDLDEYPKWKDMEFLILMQSVDQLFNQSDEPSNSNDYVVSFEKKFQKRGPTALGLQHTSLLAKHFHRKFCMLIDCDHHGYSADFVKMINAICNDKLDELLPSLKNIFPGNQISPGPSDDAPRNIFNCIEDLNDRMKMDFLGKKSRKWGGVEFLRIMTRLVEKEALFLYFDWHGTYVTCMHLLKNLHEEFRSEIDGAASGISLLPEPSEMDKVAHFLLKRLGKSEEIRKDTVKRMRKVFDRRIRKMSGPEEDEHLVIRAVNLFLVKRPRYEASRVEMELNSSWPPMYPR